MGVPRLSLVEILDQVNSAQLSTLGVAQILVKFANQNRFDLSGERIANLKTLRLFPIEGQLKRAGDVKSFEQIDVEFVQHVVDNVEASDLSPLLRKVYACALWAEMQR
jgi:hypothetical protein